MTPEDLDDLKKRRCIPCMNKPLHLHEGCWGDQQVPGYLVHLYWCECPCTVEHLLKSASWSTCRDASPHE